MLRTEQNTRRTERAVLRAARTQLGRRRLQADFEHGQWWITDLTSGAQWGAQDEDSPSGFCFELVSRGDEE